MQLRSQDPIDADAAYRENMCSIMQRDLARCHRADPALVESLLLARQVQQKCSPDRPKHLKVSKIVEICQFQQKTKWLCPYGPEIVSETSHSPSFKRPRIISDKCYEPYELRQTRFLTRNQLRAAIDDTEEQWERVLLMYQSNLDCLENLHKHPVEELIIENSVRLRKKDVLNICRCKTLKHLLIEVTEIPESFLPLFAQLKNIEKIDVQAYTDDIPQQISFMRQFPRLHVYFFRFLNFGGLTVREKKAINAFIDERRELLQHFIWCENLTSELASALARCPNLTSFEFNINRHGQGYLAAFLADPNVQRRMRHIHLDNPEFDMTGASCISNLKNIRSIYMYGSKVPTSAVSQMIVRNKKHIHTVKLNMSSSITEDILEAFAQCTSLIHADIRGTALSHRAVRAYKEAMRPNWQVIDNGQGAWEPASDSDDSFYSTESFEEWESYSTEDITDIE